MSRVSDQPRVLSVDWDYFFPDLTLYDWGHYEAPFMKEEIWATRVMSRSIRTGAEALEEAVPDMSMVNGFWDRVMTDEAPKKVFVYDSHLDLFEIIRDRINGPVHVTNFDQHHDLGYRNNNDRHVDCANWARIGILLGEIQSYRLVYPPWRKEYPEGEKRPIMGQLVGYEEPQPDPYDYVFVCRSSAWCPSWADDDFMQFVHGLTDKFWPDDTFQSAFEFEDYVFNPREIDREKAYKLKKEFEASLRAQSKVGFDRD